jgi:hypothetical protein
VLLIFDSKQGAAPPFNEQDQTVVVKMDHVLTITFLPCAILPGKVHYKAIFLLRSGVRQEFLISDVVHTRLLTKFLENK